MTMTLCKALSGSHTDKAKYKNFSYLLLIPSQLHGPTANYRENITRDKNIDSAFTAHDQEVNLIKLNTNISVNTIPNTITTARSIIQLLHGNTFHNRPIL